MTYRRWIVAGMALCLMAQPGVAANPFHRSRPKPPPAKVAVPAPPPAPVPEAPPPPYEPQLLRLAELMGALTYLRDLCREEDGNVWRARMAAIIEAEAASLPRRERLAGAFNKGFHGYQITYRACTPNAGLIITRFIDEGTRLAHEIGNRYGGG